MAKYRVLRVWASKTKIRRGQIVEDPPWRNLGTLTRTKYVELVEEPVPEMVEQPKKSETVKMPTKKEKSSGKTNKR